MNEYEKNLEICINRCNYAYELYKVNKKYYQAKRIFKANKRLYVLLEEYLYINTQAFQEIIEFIFHLEDWFEQFSELEKSLGNTLQLNSEFVFERLDESPEFPKNFLIQIKK
ncbi:MAG: hypothetical protein ED556_03070 [Winogradskyella sp.]|uniref:hypothetical protein n=1 Tax=Winogradskyella sp. TaxID=1883156 RepID=UPI000F3EC774|nr:hypothetical protein [Winogradskyella sp.]RNC88181.1 MAG: hypothetical protein ED556_03070 [Winogradskyella sp.]